MAQNFVPLNEEKGFSFSPKKRKAYFMFDSKNENFFFFFQEQKNENALENMACSKL